MCVAAARASLIGRSPQKNAATSFPATSTGQLGVAHAPAPIGGKRRAGPAPHARPRETLPCRSNSILVDNREEDRSRTNCWLRRARRLPGCHRRALPAQHSRMAHMPKDREKNRRLRKSEESSRKARPESKERLEMEEAPSEDHHGGQLSSEPRGVPGSEHEPSGNSSWDGANRQRPRRGRRWVNRGHGGTRPGQEEPIAGCRSGKQREIHNRKNGRPLRPLGRNCTKSASPGRSAASAASCPTTSSSSSPTGRYV